MGKCNLSVREQEGGAAGGLAEGLSAIWASVICLSVNIIVFVHGQTITGVTERKDETAQIFD